jgi:orotidine-5'-phosphate decarboxylase
VVTKTSFKPNSCVEQIEDVTGVKLWEKVAHMVGEWGSGTTGDCGLSNVGVVMGATYPDDAPKMRQILPNAWFLIPGFGAQGGGAKDAVVGLRSDGLGGAINNSRGLIYAYMDTKKGTLLCEDSPRCFDMVRQKAIGDRDALVTAAREAGKWPHN